MAPFQSARAMLCSPIVAVEWLVPGLMGFALIQASSVLTDLIEVVFSVQTCHSPWFVTSQSETGAAWRTSKADQHEVAKVEDRRKSSKVWVNRPRGETRHE